MVSNGTCARSPGENELSSAPRVSAMENGGGGGGGNEQGRGDAGKGRRGTVTSPTLLPYSGGALRVGNLTHQNVDAPMVSNGISAR
jgi:hypothetical protein